VSPAEKKQGSLVLGMSIIIIIIFCWANTVWLGKKLFVLTMYKDIRN
jgi:hypothetical protein